MSAATAANNLLKNSGLQFVRTFQGAARLCALYSPTHTQVQSLIDRCLPILGTVVKETQTLSVSFQFDSVVLNALPVSDPSLAWLAGEFIKRRIAAMVFSDGMDRGEMTAVLSILSARPDAVEEKGGVLAMANAESITHVRFITQAALASVEATPGMGTGAGPGGAGVPNWLLDVLGQAGIASTPESSSGEGVGEHHLQNLLLHALLKADTNVLSRIAEEASRQAEGPGGEALKSSLRHAVAAASAAQDLGRAEAILRAAAVMGLGRDDLRAIASSETVRADARERLSAYIEWISAPVEKRAEELGPSSPGLHYGWVLAAVEEALAHDNRNLAGDLLLKLFGAAGPADETERAELLDAAQALFIRFCGTRLPPAAPQFLEILSARVREENAGGPAEPLMESLALLTRLAADHEDYALATNGAVVIQEISKETSDRAAIARKIQGRLLKPETVTKLIGICLTRKNDPTVSRVLLPLLKRAGAQAARELLALLEHEQAASKRLQMLQIVKLLGRSATDALVERISDPQWYVVRNAVLALGELNDPAVLPGLEPALTHSDARVQTAAVAAAGKTRSPDRAVYLARALPGLKPSLLEGVLDDLLVLKEPRSLMYLEHFVRKPGDAKPALVEKALHAMAAVDSSDAVQTLLDCAQEVTLPLPYRRVAVQSLSRMEVKAALGALKYLAKNSSTPEIKADASNLTLWGD